MNILRLTKLFPTRSQWQRWSLPSKLTAIGAYAGVFGIFFAVIPLLVEISFLVSDRSQSINAPEVLDDPSGGLRNDIIAPNVSAEVEVFNGTIFFDSRPYDGAPENRDFNQFILANAGSVVYLDVTASFASFALDSELVRHICGRYTRSISSTAGTGLGTDFFAPSLPIGTLDLAFDRISSLGGFDLRKAAIDGLADTDGILTDGEIAELEHHCADAIFIQKGDYHSEHPCGSPCYQHHFQGFYWVQRNRDKFDDYYVLREHPASVTEWAAAKRAIAVFDRKP